MLSFFTDHSEKIIALSAFVVSIFSVYYSRKSSQSVLLSQLIEKESEYVSECNNVKFDKYDSDLKYLNHLETISLFYNQGEVNKKTTKKYFINIFWQTYKLKKGIIKDRIKNNDFEELSKVLKEWKIK